MIDKNRYITRLAIKDADSHILGYEVMYSGSDAYGVTNASEASAAETIYNCLIQNSEKALSDSRTFMTFTSSLLAKKTPHLFKSTDLVIQIDDSVIIHPFAMHLLQQYADEGYEVAANDFQFAPRYLALLDQLSYIKINMKTLNHSSAENIMRIAKSMNKRVIATNVDDEEIYNFAKEIGVYGMQGAYIADKMANKVNQSGYLRSNFFRLVVAVTKEDPDIHEIEEIISADVTLTYSLLKIANSAYFARRTKTDSIRQAIVTLGLNQLKRWVYLLTVGDNDESSLQEFEEFIKLSFMRASFASELQHYMKGSTITQSEAYMLGMFSTLEYLIDASMAEILKDIPLTDEMKNALISGEGQGGTLLSLIICYEKADWKNISVKAEELGIPTNMLTTVYFNCMKNVNEIWEQMTDPQFDQEVLQ